MNSEEKFKTSTVGRLRSSSRRLLSSIDGYAESSAVPKGELFRGDIIEPVLMEVVGVGTQRAGVLGARAEVADCRAGPSTPRWSEQGRRLRI